MNKRGIEATKQKKSKKRTKWRRKNKINFKTRKIETSVDEIIDIIDKDGIEEKKK